MVVSPIEIPGRILVRGSPIPNPADFVEVVNEFTDTWQDIIRALGVQKLNPLQERIILALEAGLDVFVAGPKKEGKRTAYLIPVLGHVLGELLQSELTEAEREASPATIIICESAMEGIELRNMLENVFQKFCSSLCPSESPKVILMDNIHNEDMVASVRETLDILILTAAALKELLTMGRIGDSLHLKFHRARYVIFEELAMKQLYLEKEVIQFLAEMPDKVTGQTILQKLPSNAQLIFSGTIWYNDHIGLVRKKLCNVGRKSSIILGSTHHALQFSSSITWKMDHVTSDKAKLNLLIGICKGMLMEKRKIAVACSTPSVATTVSKYISENGGICNSVVTSGRKDTSGVFKRNRDWLGSVFVVSDNAWEDFEEYDLSCLVHFDINLPPNGTKDLDNKPFCQERFSCMWTRMERAWRSIVEPHGLTHFLLSGNEPNFLAFYKFLRAANIKLPMNLEETAEQKSQLEMLSMPLCTHLKCFAFCNIIDCPYRHEISQEDLDISPFAPANGELEFKVVRSLNPSLYVAQLLNHYIFDEKSGKRICVKAYRQEARERIEQMMDHYSIERNRVHPLKVALNELYCVPINRQPSRQNQKPSSILTAYLRAKIVRFLYENCSGTYSSSDDGPADYAEVFCLDVGTTMVTPLTDLMVLPEQFRKWKPHCIQVVLSNLLYLQETREYHSDALEATQFITEGKIWHGRVLLSIRDTVWVNPMVQYETDPVTGQLTLGCNLIVELINCNYAAVQDSHKHIMMMLEYIRKQDPNYPEIEHEMNSTSCRSQCAERFHKQGDPIKWAELPLTDVEQDNGCTSGRQLSSVDFTIYSWITPWEIYGVVCEPEEKGLILQLEQSLTQEMDIGSENKKKSFGELATLLNVGSVVAVKTTLKGRWQRGLILQYEMGEEIGNRLKVFLVDYGLIATDLLLLEQVLPLPKVYVEAIPFQTVCLQLAHIQPVNGESKWSDKEIERFNCMMDSNNSVKVVAFAKMEDGSHQCNYYQAMAYRIIEGQVDNGFPLQEIGIQLVEKKCAEITTAVVKIFSVVGTITSMSTRCCTPAPISATSSKSSSYISSIDFEERSLEEDDEDSETSLERWRRFCDVEMEPGEYVVIAHDDGSQSLNGKIGMLKNESSEENEKFGFQELAGLPLTIKEHDDEHLDMNKYEENSKDDDFGDDEFYDALEDAMHTDIDYGLDVSPEEELALTQLREKFLSTL